jgi:hypothetical protein
MARVELVEDVRVFVERRSVANLDLAIDEDGTHRQCDKPLSILVRQRFEHPVSRGTRGRVKALGLIHAQGDLVVVAPDDGLRVECANRLNDLVRIRPIADDVAKNERLVVASSPRVLQACIQSFEVRVNVSQQQIAHQASSQWASSSTIAGIRD